MAVVVVVIVVTPTLARTKARRAQCTAYTVLPPFQNKSYVLEKSVGLRSFFAL